MDSYPAELDLVVGLDQGDELVRLCASGELSFAAFSAQYGSLYWSAALDGHESDEIGVALLRKYSDRIALHRELAETVLARVCSAADAERDEYRKLGRFGPDEAVARLRVLAAALLKEASRPGIDGSGRLAPNA